MKTAIRLIAAMAVAATAIGPAAEAAQTQGQTQGPAAEAAQTEARGTQARTESRKKVKGEKVYTFEWSAAYMDNTRTGCTAAGSAEFDKSIGTVKGGKYISPNGSRFRGHTKKAAKDLLKVQGGIAPTREVVGYAPNAMTKRYPECELSNFAADMIRWGAEYAFGRKVDVGIGNYGGIRITMPQGEILKEDIVSMFPFKNYIAIATMNGKQLREILTTFAEMTPQPLSGASIVIEDGRLVEAKVGGEPLDDNGTYTVGTVDFLLDGGDHLYIGKDAEVYISNVLLSEYVLIKLAEMKAEGKLIESEVEGRVIVR